MVLRILLYPLAVLYNVITALRNRLYDQGYKPSARFEIPLVSVGNLAVGGTGKTPMIEHLIRLLKSGHTVATLSRGYGRLTKGVRIAGAADTAETLGDEPFQFYKKFGREVTVVVGEERALAIPVLADEHPEVNVVLLDDAYQHRQVVPAFQVLLTDYNAPFYKDYLLPAGRLRESRYGAQRADVIVVTKCPAGLAEEEMIAIEMAIRKYSHKPIFFTAIRYGNMVPMGAKASGLPDKVVLVTGLARALPLVEYVKRSYSLVKHFEFADHHYYTEGEMTAVVTVAQAEKAVVITTEKDAARLEAEKFRSFLSAIPFYYLPIEVEFLKNGKDFDEMVLNAVKNA